MCRYLCIHTHTHTRTYGDRDNPVVIATVWTVRGSNPGVGEIFLIVQTGPETHPVSCKMRTEPLPGVKRPRRGADHSHS